MFYVWGSFDVFVSGKNQIPKTKLVVTKWIWAVLREIYKLDLFSGGDLNFLSGKTKEIALNC